MYFCYFCMPQRLTYSALGRLERDMWYSGHLNSHSISIYLKQFQFWLEMLTIFLVSRIYIISDTADKVWTVLRFISYPIFVNRALRYNKKVLPVFQQETYVRKDISEWSLSSIWSVQSVNFISVSLIANSWRTFIINFCRRDV